MTNHVLGLILAAGALAALVIGAADVPRARRGLCPPEQPVGLVLLAACLGWLAFAVTPQ